MTLARLREASASAYLGADGLAGFDLVLSYTGGAALADLRAAARRAPVAPLYGHVDPQVHRPVAPVARYRADLSYLGTYAADRQHALEALFVDAGAAAARAALPHRRRAVPARLPVDATTSTSSATCRRSEHPAFFSSSRLTLNVTRHAMAAMGWCPSGRLFEAAACGTAILSDHWEGLDAFFEPGREILVAAERRRRRSRRCDLSDARARAHRRGRAERVARRAHLRASRENACRPASKTQRGCRAPRMRQPAEA